MSIKTSYNKIASDLPKKVLLVAVSKTKPIEVLQEAYDCGVRIFGENRVQELVKKHDALEKDIEWHMIGHLQSKKVKHIAPFVSLIHSVDSIKLLEVINKEGEKNNRRIPVLLQFHIAKEDSKYGFRLDEVDTVMNEINGLDLDYVSIKGLMGMATFTDDKEQIKQEFKRLKHTFTHVKNNYLPSISELSMGMSGDYQLAIEEGSTMIRVGSLIFGKR